MTWWERRYYAVLNALMRVLLRSPLHGLRSAHIILLQFTGRRSGRGYRMPVSYWQRAEDEVICLTSTAWSRWWVNLDGASVGLVLRGVTRHGRSELVADPALRPRSFASPCTPGTRDRPVRPAPPGPGPGSSARRRRRAAPAPPRPR